MGVDIRSLKDRKIDELQESIRRSKELLDAEEVEGPARVYFENLLKDSQDELVEILLLGKYGD